MLWWSDGGERKLLFQEWDATTNPRGNASWQWSTQETFLFHTSVNIITLQDIQLSFSKCKLCALVHFGKRRISFITLLLFCLTWRKWNVLSCQILLLVFVLCLLEIYFIINWLVDKSGPFTLWLLENLMRYLMFITYKGHKHVETPHLRAYVVDAIPVAYHITVLLFVFLLICLKRQEKHGIFFVTMSFVIFNLFFRGFN